ncbi:response regulator [Vibrio sp. JC009]|uniref:response regulator n=1 Tax=Vibrio sp. JC009 TaxID=2912314 RepID=UPI0023B118EC|nr:response regulator [Vibrio sp. JC009]WED23405.1 response regulator [Vibrio sp. JC009]
MSKTILIVDDSDSLRQVVSIALSGVGYTVLEARDGKEGLLQLNDNRVHLIISDFNMPNMNGIEFVRNAKQINKYKFTPILMLTTESQKHLVEESKKAGAIAWMLKPFRPEKMIDTVSKLIA